MKTDTGAQKAGSYHALIPAAAKEWGLPVEGCSAQTGKNR